MNIEKTEALASGNDIENPTIVYKEDKKRGFSLLWIKKGEWKMFNQEALRVPPPRETQV